jgi:hypothetical protein
MTTETYLKQLRRAARRLPRSDRDELVGQIEEHLREALPPGAGESVVRTELDRLGSPAEIVAAEHERLGLAAPTGGFFEWITLLLLLVGSLIIPVVGWLIGAIMLWISRVWTWREKLAGTLIMPGGLAAVVLFGLLVAGSTSKCVSGPGVPTRCTQAGPLVPDALSIPLLVIWAVASIAMVVHLGRQVRRER